MCSTTLGSGPRSDSATTPAIPNTGADSPLTRGTVPSRKKVLRVHRIAASTERERSDVRARPDRHVATDRGAGFKAQGRRGRRGDAGARQASAAGGLCRGRGSGASWRGIGEIADRVVGEHCDGNDDLDTVAITEDDAVDDGMEAQEREDVTVGLCIVDTFRPRLVRAGAGERRQHDQADQDSDDCDGSAHHVSTSCKNLAIAAKYQRLDAYAGGTCRRMTKASTFPTFSPGLTQH